MQLTQYNTPTPTSVNSGSPNSANYKIAPRSRVIEDDDMISIEGSSIIFENLGSITVRVDNIPIPPGGSKSFGGSTGEVRKHKFLIRFATTYGYNENKQLYISYDVRSNENQNIDLDIWQ